LLVMVRSSSSVSANGLPPALTEPDPLLLAGTDPRHAQ
jgi:hypothetical protein